MKREQAVDFFCVEDRHAEIHARLLNWARWVRPGRGMTGLHPMFRQYRSTETVADPQQVRIAPDGTDGLAVERVICSPGFPEINRTALQWNYVFTFIPVGKVCRHMAVNDRGLAKLVSDGRTMVVNRL